MIAWLYGAERGRGMFFKECRDRRAKEKAEAKENENRARRERLEEDLKEAEAFIQGSVEEMLGKDCPFIKGKCFEECVHFDGGLAFVAWFPHPAVGKHVMRHPAKCKIWSKT